MVMEIAENEEQRKESKRERVAGMQVWAQG